LIAPKAQSFRVNVRQLKMVNFEIEKRWQRELQRNLFSDAYSFFRY
jgi:hypothetical protein